MYVLGGRSERTFGCNFFVKNNLVMGMDLEVRNEEVNAPRLRRLRHLEVNKNTIVT